MIRTYLEAGVLIAAARGKEPIAMARRMPRACPVENYVAASLAARPLGGSRRT